MTRVLLYTGKGGVGKTTSAAGTATLAALRGLRTLVLSTDAAHSLSDAFDSEVGPEPTEIDDLLFVQQINAQRKFERSWGDIQAYLRSVLHMVGVDPVEAEELTVLPGAEEVLALLEVRDHVRSGRWDVIVVDCAPTAETLRLLALPEALNWYLERIFNAERKMMRTFRPFLNRGSSIPMPDDTVFDALRRLQADLSDIRTLLAGPDASVRLVLTPEAVVVAEARRSLTRLSLYGYRVDGVVANRVFPAAGADTWRRQWVAAQRGILEEVADSFRPLPIWESPYRVCEPVGVEELAAFAVEMYGGDDPFARATDDTSLWVDRHIDTDGRTYTLTMPLPLASADELELARHGDELIITVGSYRRVLPLPAALARGVVAGARLDEGRLQVRFSPRETARPVAPSSDVPSGSGPLESAQELAQGLTAEYHEALTRREAAR
ncbi:arsenite efflux ATP-binding protein ArsA [Kribbella sp. VKM Ac-2569]|uniref:ArsA family ATPase n=1 Tax=Kribbella sp. VKM Ac-2569 TaxID=2512220 RepID=UPI00102C0345|nr:ArsA family ATPase [Kribbella sp. VKM Ac-2569]RZT26723.1 arsenite efflux ATP-binding protein ArsA [Kribbella sp. VKM Ac-2569]